MEIGNKKGKVCIQKADLPIVIDAKIIEGNAIAFSISDKENPEPIEILPESLKTLNMGQRTKAAMDNLIICFEEIDHGGGMGHDVVRQWIKRLIVITARNFPEDQKQELKEEINKYFK